MQLLLLPCVASPRKPNRARKHRRIIPASWRLPISAPHRSAGVERFIRTFVESTWQRISLVTLLRPIGRGCRYFPTTPGPDAETAGHRAALAAELALPGWRGDGVLIFDGEAWSPDFPPIAVPIHATGPRELLPLAVVAARVRQPATP